jgi:ribosomal protein L2
VIGARSAYQIPCGKTLVHLGGNLDRQSRFARSAGAGQRDKAVVGQEGANVGHLRMAADKRRQLRRKVMSGRGIRRP